MADHPNRALVHKQARNFLPTFFLFNTATLSKSCIKQSEHQKSDDVQSLARNALAWKCSSLQVAHTLLTRKPSKKARKQVGRQAGK